MFSKKSLRGAVCRECASWLSKGVHLDTAEDSYLKKAVQDAKDKAEKFTATASYGNLYIDQNNGMFCVSEHHSGDMPTSFSDVFSAEELTAIGLFCTDVKNIGTNSNRVVCSVKFTVRTDDFYTEYIIARNKDCPFKTVGNKLDYEEPAELGMFRTMINQMLENTTLRFIKYLEKIRELNRMTTQEQKNTEWAKGVMLFREEEILTLKTLRERRNFLIKTFHPDYNKASSSDEFAAVINEAYSILSEGVKK